MSATPHDIEQEFQLRSIPKTNEPWKSWYMAMGPSRPKVSDWGRIGSDEGFYDTVCEPHKSLLASQIATFLDLERRRTRLDSLAASHLGVDHMPYTLARMSNLGSYEREEIYLKLDEVGRLHEISSALELPDESWEMVVLKSYLPELEIKLHEIFPGCQFEPNYDPTEPGEKDLDYLAASLQPPAEHGEMDEDLVRCLYIKAKIMRIEASSNRAMVIIGQSLWSEATAYYYCLLEHNMTLLREISGSWKACEMGSDHIP